MDSNYLLFFLRVIQGMYNYLQNINNYSNNSHIYCLLGVLGALLALSLTLLMTLLGCSYRSYILNDHSYLCLLV